MVSERFQPSPKIRLATNLPLISFRRTLKKSIDSKSLLYLKKCGVFLIESMFIFQFRRGFLSHLEDDYSHIGACQSASATDEVRVVRQIGEETTADCDREQHPTSHFAGEEQRSLARIGLRSARKVFEIPDHSPQAVIPPCHWT